MAKHPKLLEAIENAKAAAASTRGMYPYTKAENVFFADGTALETMIDEELEDDDTDN